MRHADAVPRAQANGMPTARTGIEHAARELCSALASDNPRLTAPGFCALWVRTRPTAPSNTVELHVRERDGIYRPATAAEIHAAALSHLRAYRIRRGRALSSPALVREYLAVAYGARESELFGTLMLDQRNQLLGVAELFNGTIGGASVHPREVVKTALAANAATVVLFHNHPSGNPEPSNADEIVTRRVRDALGLVDVRVIDHVIVAGDAYVSFAERGLL